VHWPARCVGNDHEHDPPLTVLSGPATWFAAAVGASPRLLAGAICKPMTRRITLVELRGIEPLALPAEMGSEQRRPFVCVVTQRLRVLRICAGVLRDVTVLGLGLGQARPRPASCTSGLQARLSRPRSCEALTF
jgi:hypothetical protein